MNGRLAAICRHPVKGFTPEPLDAVRLEAGGAFPHDRVFAVENGPSGYDPAAPAFVPKQKFTVLASLPRVGAARTRYEPQTATLRASAPGLPDFSGRLSEAAGRGAFAAWLTALLGEGVRGPLKVVEAVGRHRFTDHPQGHVSVVSLASLRDLSARLGRHVAPSRFRANLYVDGWPPWAELAWSGRELSLGSLRAEVFKPIVRCAATHVDPQTAERDLDVTKALFDQFGHMHCGVYVRVTAGGRLEVGDPCPALAAASHVTEEDA